MKDNNSLKSSCKAFNELSLIELYCILQLRTEIFVLEQQCLYQDMDGMDQKAYHFMIFDKANTLIAYSRLFPPGIAYKEAAIGRIITKTHGLGLGNILLKKSIDQVSLIFGKANIRIGAQCYAIPFYEKFGFKTEGDTYLEDNIPHIEMLRINDQNLNSL